ncbi:hypothetical protein BKA61DRAFT_674874 [Leptodontidium sp. MPI-SDFR-AT-0119]|nr:hypothetical protein BKA61DRAFT_674874 [Leptodontidium sp. MPI-SDFR-AT-0119]
MVAILVGIFFNILYLLSLAFWNILVWVLTWLPYIALCVCVPIAFSIWLFSVDTGIVYLFELLWTKRGDTARRIWQGIVTLFIHLILWRCVHAGNCKCFRGWIPLEEHEILLADVEPSLRTQLATALADFAKEKQNNTSLNVSSGRWRERALAAEKLNGFCRREHRDLEDFRKANVEFRKRVSDLQKENADLRTDYNLERRSKGRYPLFDDHPGNLAARNRELEQQVHILLGDIKNAHETLDRSQPFSTQERVESETEITRLQKMVTSYDEEIRELNERNSELEKLSKLSHDDAKTALRNRILDLQNQLRVTTAERNDAIRDKAKAEKLVAISQEGGSDGPPGNTDWKGISGVEKLEAVIALLKETDLEVGRLSGLRKSRGSATDSGSGLPPPPFSLFRSGPPPPSSPGNTDWNAGIIGVEKLEAIIALFKETDLEVGRLSGLRKSRGSATDSGSRLPPPPFSPFRSASPPPSPLFPPPPTVPGASPGPPVAPNQLESGARGSSNDDAIRELTYIYDRLKVIMIEIKKVEPGQSVNLGNLIELLKLVPGLFKSQEETKARFAAHQTKNEIHEAQAATMLQNLNKYRQTIQRYHEAARQARERMDPGTATDPDYTVGDFIPQAVAAIEMLNTKIEQQMKFNRSTPNERLAQLESLQAENISLKVKIETAAPMYHKVMMEADRLRLEIETQAINSRRPEDKRRHAVYCNLDAVLHETNEFIDSFKMEYPDFVVPKWVQDLYTIEYRDSNDLPTVEETKEVARKIRQVVDWMLEENWPGSRLEWHDSIVEGFPPSKEDKLGIVLQKLMVRIDRALNELEIHTYEIWTNSKTQKTAAEAMTPIPPTPKGCTCPPQRPGTFTVPGSPCPVCAALESVSESKGAFTDQLNRNRKRRNRAGEQNTKRSDKASSSKNPPASGYPWSPKPPKTTYNSTKPTRPNTSRFNFAGITNQTTISPRLNFSSIRGFQSTSRIRRNAPNPLHLDITKSSSLDDLPNLK